MTTPDPGTEVCIGCGHWIGAHFNDVTGVARCTLKRRHTSTTGVIGITSEESCRCANFEVAP